MYCSKDLNWETSNQYTQCFIKMSKLKFAKFQEHFKNQETTQLDVFS